jgi:hypothetical protein
VLWRRAKARLRASLACTRANSSSLTSAGTLATGSHSADGTGTDESGGLPIGWVAERRRRGARLRHRPA